MQAKKEFAENVEKMRQRRNLNFENTFPEMLKFLYECRTIE